LFNARRPTSNLAFTLPLSGCGTIQAMMRADFGDIYVQNQAQNLPVIFVSTTG
jgi:hypothetical protein